MSDTEYDPVPDEEQNGDTPGSDKKNVGFSQAGIIEMSTLITNPGMKRAESLETLRLTLHQCARDGNPDNMRRLLATFSTNNRKKKVNAKDDDNLTALHYASRYNHYQIVKMLLDAGADVDAVDDEGATCLHFAARYKRVRFSAETPEERPELNSTVENSVILYLVYQNANVNARDIYGCPPLHFAAMRGNELATQELLSCKGINIEAVDKQQMTALHLAASHNEAEICRMLIEKGANLRCCDEDRCTPLHYACMEGNLEITKMLFEAGEQQDGWVTVSQMVTDQDNQDNTPLHLSVENKSLDVAKLCIEKGADVNTPSDNYSTPLHTAAVVGDIDIIKLLIDQSARIDALDINQSTPLHRAAAYNHAEVVKYLLDRGARIDKHDKDNFTPLLIAACNGHADSIKALLDNGADLFAVDKNDKTAIYWAAEEDNLEALKVLLTNASRQLDLLDQSDRYENSPLHIAAEKGFINCVMALLDAGAKLDAKNEEERTPLHLAAMNGKTNVLRELVKRDKMTITDEDEDSNTPLHLAAMAGHNKATLALLDAGADFEARNCSLWTPLDCASSKGWVKTCKVLLEADAPVDPMDKSKTTPLHLAASRGHVQVVNLLIKWNASVSQRDGDGRNCLDLAIENGHRDVAMAIINSPKWKESLRNETIDLKNGYRNTPMRKLIRKMPDVAERVFNLCTTRNMNNPDAQNYQITFNYEFLDDQYADWREKPDAGSDSMSTVGSIYNEDDKLVDGVQPYSNNTTILKVNHPLYLMVTNKQEDLLAHPLVTTLLRHKWLSFGAYFYYINLFVYCIFLTFLTGYVLTTSSPYYYYDVTMFPNATLCENVRDNYPVPVTQHILAMIAKYIIMVLSGINIIRELFQMYNAKLNYLGWENLIEWITYIFALLLVIDFNTCQAETGIREDWQWQIGAVAIFLAWLELVLFIRKFPRFGIYVVMFTDILYTFIQFLPVFVLFIVAFALAFFVLLANQPSFAGVGESMIKTFVMMIGEMEFTAIFLGLTELDDGASLEDQHEAKVYYPGITYPLFVVFLIIMTLLIMNLLIGLAVDDIKAVQEQAVLKRLAMQVELALEVESYLPQFIRRRFITRCKNILPNEHSKNACYNLFKLGSNAMSSAAIQKALDPDLTDMERLEENQDKMLKQINTLRFRMKNFEGQQEKMSGMLTALLKSMDVDYIEEDIQVEEDL